MQAGRESGSLNKLDGKKCLQEEGEIFFAALAVALDVGIRYQTARVRVRLQGTPRG